MNDAPPLELEATALTAPGEAERVLAPDVSWRVAAGEFWVVAGAPGSGKSTLLGACAGLLRLLGGAARLFGASLHAGGRGLAAARARTGLVFTGGRLFRQFTLVENIALPLAYHHAAEGDAARVRALLDAVALGVAARRRPDEVTRGERLRAALARALALGPELLLLDEPLAGLPPGERDWWLAFAAGAAGPPRPRTVVVATFDPAPWLALGPRRAGLEAGRWAVAGGAPAAAAATAPLHPSPPPA